MLLALLICYLFFSLAISSSIAALFSLPPTSIQRLHFYTLFYLLAYRALSTSQSKLLLAMKRLHPLALSMPVSASDILIKEKI